jgi:hypothetical protein
LVDQDALVIVAQPDMPIEKLSERTLADVNFVWLTVTEPLMSVKPSAGHLRCAVLICLRMTPRPQV